MTPEEFYAQLKTFDIVLNDNQKVQFERYFELLVEWNEKNKLNGDYRKKRSLFETFLRLDCTTFVSTR